MLVANLAAFQVRHVLKSFVYADPRHDSLDGKEDSDVFRHYCTEAGKLSSVNRLKNHWATVMIDAL
jgi:hypothetical protein